MNETMLKAAMKELHISEEDARKCNKPISEIGCWYFWSPTRGGKAMLIDKDGERLIAPSSISFDRHVAEFKKGRRN